MRTRLTELLGIRHPIILPGMAYVSLAPLAAAVCNAGGLGVLGIYDSPDNLRQSIRKMRELTDKPFGVNVVPIVPAVGEFVKVIIEEKVPVVTSGLGDPAALMGGKRPGMLMIPACGTVGQAIAAERNGADAVIVTGSEAGGHVGNISTLVLLSKVTARVKIPVIAAGGFCDGRGLIAALALGAEGIAMGTRFAVTQESPIPPQAQQVLVEAKEGMATVSTRYDGLPLRAIKGSSVTNYRGWWSRPWELLPHAQGLSKAYKVPRSETMKVVPVLRKLKIPVLQFVCGIDMVRKFASEGDVKGGVGPCGQVIGLVNDIPTCNELIERIIAQAERTSESVRAKALLS
ncbi:MAG: nitronate monooxygenase [Dehalococcoidia bacterium]|nr:nitronate monooxygenase [Dehalococcoidia bacterium]